MNLLKGRYFALCGFIITIYSPFCPVWADPAPDQTIHVTGDAAPREGIDPNLGANDYALTLPAIDDQPQGENRPFDQTLLQAPGFSQDNFGQVHLRNEHANLQYRINGIILPSGLSGFSEPFDSRFADRIDILTGTLPAEYGYRTSGVVTITTKSGDINPGGVADLYGGAHDTAQPSLQYGGSQNGLSYYATGSYLHSDEGVENPTSGYNAIHDVTNQARGFAYVSQAFSPDTKLSAMLGSFGGTFQIPNLPGAAPAFQANGISAFESAHLNQTQSEQNHYGVVALQGSSDAFDYQLAPFIRYTQTDFRPDTTGDLVFNGFADRTTMYDTASGVQFDGGYSGFANHTLRSGFYITAEHTGTDDLASVFTNGTGTTNQFGTVQDSDTPTTIADNSEKTGYFYSLYGEDEWRVSDKLTVNYGLRFDVVNAYTDENQISPRLNVVYRPINGTVLHAGYARNFTPPPQELVASTSVARFAGTTQAPAVTTNGNVKAEREHYFDVGGTQKILPGLDAGLDGYYKIKRNLLDEGQFGESLVYSPFNYSFGQAYGLEATTNYRVDAFRTYANLAYGQEKGKNIVSSQFFFSADELAYIASHSIFTDHDQKWTASAGASYDFRNAGGTLTPSLDLIYGSGLRADPTNGVLEPNGTHLPGYVQANLGVVQNFDLGGWLQGVAMRFDIINLTDRTYEIRDGTGVGVGASQYGPRRTVFAGVSKKF